MILEIGHIHMCFLYALLLFLLPGAHGDSAFSAWLSKVKVELPDQVTVQTPFEIGLTNITCGEFVVQSLHSSFPAPLRYSLTGRGMHFDCNMVFAYRNMYFPFVPKGGGNLRVKGESPSISLALSLSLLQQNQSSYPLVEKVNTDECLAELSVSELQLPELGLGATASILTAVVRTTVQLFLPTVICDQFTLLFEQNLTSSLGELNQEVLLPMLNYPLISSELPLDVNLSAHVFSWKDSTLFQLVTAALDEDGVSEIEHILADNGLSTPPPSNSSSPSSSSSLWCELSSNVEGPGINTLMDIATNEDGVISLSTNLGPFILSGDAQPQASSEQAGGVIAASVSINQVNVSGLRAFQNFSLLRTLNTNASLVDDYVLTSLLKLPDIRLLLHGTIEVTVVDNNNEFAQLREEAVVNISLDNITAYWTMVSALDVDRFQQLKIGQLSSLDCWVLALADLNATDSGLFLEIVDMSVLASDTAQGCVVVLVVYCVVLCIKIFFFVFCVYVENKNKQTNNSKLWFP